ncbi:hypothetical protein [Psychroserpens mesophilus]|uniref:hypothetical protein n=1 Tax=Psychroserpens mesophilus TaxID=325473 RepID=UPI00058C782D|nr:hypothetical protein [Psychroserpens mesophilus]
MSYYADIYVFKETRSKNLVNDFLNHFIPLREESADEYQIPQYSDNPTREFKNANEIMTFLESNNEYSQSIYWKNTDENSRNKHGMVFYTNDGFLIFGISRNADMSGNLLTDNEDDCLKQMKEFFKTEFGYIDYENPPVNSKTEFMKIVKNLKSE